MSPDPDLLAPYRPIILADVRQLIDGLGHSFAEVLKQQLELIEAEESALELCLAASALCLLASDVLGGDAGAALPLATGLAFLQLMTIVLRGLAATEVAVPGAVEREWGMPRTLNAGDAFYALAQKSLLRPAAGGMEGARLIAAAKILGSAARRLCEGLHEPGPNGGYQPFVQALSLGAIAAGASEMTISRLEATRDGTQSDETTLREQLNALDIDGGARARLEEAVACLMKTREA